MPRRKSSVFRAGDDAAKGRRKPSITEYGVFEMREVAAVTVEEMFEALGDETVESLTAESLELSKLTQHMFLTVMCGLLKENPNLTNLSLASNGLKTLQIEHIGAALANHGKLRNISFRDNAITTTGANKFARAIKDNEVLRYVDFDENHIGPKFPMDLFLIPGIRKIEMYSNRIETLPARLGEMEKLEDLDVRRNRINLRELGFKPPPRWLTDGQIMKAEWEMMEAQHLKSEEEKARKRKEDRDESRRRALLEKGHRRRMSVENVVAARKLSVFGDTALGLAEIQKLQAGMLNPDEAGPSPLKGSKTSKVKQHDIPPFPSSK